jgi:hypothetical protein
MGKTITGQLIYISRYHFFGYHNQQTNTEKNTSIPLFEVISPQLFWLSILNILLDDIFAGLHCDISLILYQGFHRRLGSNLTLRILYNQNKLQGNNLYRHMLWYKMSSYTFKSMISIRDLYRPTAEAKTSLGLLSPSRSNLPSPSSSTRV